MILNPNLVLEILQQTVAVIMLYFNQVTFYSLVFNSKIKKNKRINVQINTIMFICILIEMNLAFVYHYNDNDDEIIGGFRA